MAEAFLLGLALKQRGVKNSLGWHGFDQNLRQVVQQFLPMVAGAFLMGSTLLVDQAFAASMPAGNVSVLNYGNKIISFPLQIAATAIGTSVLPYFSSMLARQDWQAARQTLNRYLKLIFLFAVPRPVAGRFLEPSCAFPTRFTEQDTDRGGCAGLGALQLYRRILIVRMLSAVKANNIIMWIPS
jgi:putative peptidoglycan lipid II flippase